LAPRDKRERLLVRERKAIQKQAHRVLQAAVVEAYGRAGTYVIMDMVMKRADISDPEEFRTIAEYLDQQGWIAEADPDYGVFVLTPEGIDEAMN
jgi:RIO-like serine/threonine protein kinase